MQTQTFNISLPKALIQKIDQVAKEEYRSRSELIREAVRVYLDRRSKWNEIFRVSEKGMARMGVENEEDVARIVNEYRHGRQKSR